MNGTISNQKINNQLLYKVYGWMAVGLMLTATVSFYIAQNPKIVNLIFKNFGVLLILFLLQLGLVFALSFFLNKMSSLTATFVFLFYSFVNGITLSSIFLVYTQTSIAVTFLVTAGMFCAMAIYGYVTKSDLTGMGNFLFMALIGLIIALFINMFLKSSTFNYIISAIGVLIFSLLTAYDVQQIKKLGSQLILQGESLSKIAILGALKLYLDFINLFLYLLQFIGKRKES